MRGGIVVRQSKTFIPTTREVPSSAEATSHKLLIKAGMVKQVSAGVYTYLPLATRVIQKIEKVIREEHSKIGAAELLMPIYNQMNIGKIWSLGQNGSGTYSCNR